MIGQQLKKLRKLHGGMSQAELADFLGVSQQAVGQWERGKNKPEYAMLCKIASFFGVTTDFLLGDIIESGSTDLLRIVKKDANLVPRIGVIACGTPILAEQNIEGYEYLRSDIQADFALVANGDSMQGARICDGDIVFIKQQEDVEDGQIAAVMIDGEATLKRIYHTGDTITLAPANPKYPPKVYSKDNCQQFKILGLVVCVQIRF